MNNQNSISKTSDLNAKSFSGGILLILFLIILGACVFGIITNAANDNEKEIPLFIFGIIISSLLATGFYMVQPNEAVAVTLFGRYMGTDKNAGLRWVLPWYGKRKISLRVRNIVSDKLKVNDKAGNPIEIAANVVWRVQDSAQALFDIYNYETFCGIEIDTALRDIAAHYAYDHSEEGELTLRGHAEEVAALLGKKLNERLAIGGMIVDEARISHLAYAPEIAGAMLRRQQAQAVISARQLIVQGAVSMVDQALKDLAKHEIVNLDDERKAQMVSNLLVVLCSDKDAQPVLNTSSLY